MSQEYYFTVPGREFADDEILIFSHRHLMVFLGPLIITILLTIFPLVFGIILGSYSAESPLSADVKIMIIVFMSVYYLILSSYLFIEWITYYYDILIVTENTIVDIRQNNVFNREISHLHLRQIEDISSEVKGFFPTLFNYGDIIIQTAGAQERSIIQSIPNPQKVAAMILQLHKNVLAQNKDLEGD